MQETQETRVPFLAWEDSPGEGNGNPLQYSWLKNSMDRGGWCATIYRAAKGSDRSEHRAPCTLCGIKYIHIIGHVSWYLQHHPSLKSSWSFPTEILYPSNINLPFFLPLALDTYFSTSYMNDFHSSMYLI